MLSDCLNLDCYCFDFINEPKDSLFMRKTLLEFFFIVFVEKYYKGNII